MDIKAIGVVGLADSRMTWLAERQKAVAQNVANADQPGYRARDLPPFAEMLSGAQSRLALAATRPAHLAGTRPGGPLAPRPVETWSADPNGNSVNLEEQMVLSGEIRDAYGLAAGVYQRSMGFFRIATGQQ